MHQRIIVRSLFLAATSFAIAGCAETSEDPSSTDDALTNGTRPWDEAAESEFSAWIAAIGNARAAGKCTKLNACMEDPTINTLKKPSDPPLDLFADCADVPMELRGYFAVKTNRPFRFVSEVEGTGPDERYAANVHPTAWSTAASSSTMQKLMTRISNTVHSGFFRMAASVEGSDTYPIQVSSKSLRPGTVFYDPNGHVLIVYRIDTDGTVWTMDGHPDNSLTFGRFLEGRYAVGGPSQGGGFRNFRPQRVVGSSIELAKNSELTDLGSNQYGHGSNYVAWVRSQISTGPGPTPEAQVNDALDQLCVDLNNRVTAVADASALARGQLGPIPPNIYGADGDWEALSTPGRDARLRGSFRMIHRLVKSSLEASDDRAALKTKLVETWTRHLGSSTCKVKYRASNGGEVSLSLTEVSARIYDLSFDPYHCPEMRWGAHPRSRAEMATCSNADSAHIARFDAERRNRNVIDRTPAAITGPDYGPEQPEDIDLGALFQSL